MTSAECFFNRSSSKPRLSDSCFPSVSLSAPSVQQSFEHFVPLRSTIFACERTCHRRPTTTTELNNPQSLFHLTMAPEKGTSTKGHWKSTGEFAESCHRCFIDKEKEAVQAGLPRAPDDAFEQSDCKDKNSAAHQKAVKKHPSTNKQNDKDKKIQDHFNVQCKKFRIWCATGERALHCGVALDLFFFLLRVIVSTQFNLAIFSP